MGFIGFIPNTGKLFLRVAHLIIRARKFCLSRQIIDNLNYKKRLCGI